MALTDEQIEGLADQYLVDLYQQLEKDVIQDIARRVHKTSRWTETAEIQANALREQGYSPSKIYAEVLKQLNADSEYQKMVSENTKEYKREVAEIIADTVKQAREAGNELVAEAGDMAYNAEMSMWEQAGVDLTKPNTLDQLVKGFQKSLGVELKNLTRTTGFVGTQLGTTAVKNAYTKTLDVALVKVASGAFSYDAAVEDACKLLADSGLRKIDYASGRSYQLDTAARMCVRTSAHQLSGKITEANIEETGVDLVITSQHIGSRPEHAVWQGKVFSYDGRNKNYPDFVESTGYGDVTGLMGVNCRHAFYPFWEGISDVPEPLEEPDPVEVGGKEYTYYQATQKQRSMERDIRKMKREQYTTSDPAQRLLLDRKIDHAINNYNEFSRKVGIRAKDNRLRIVGEPYRGPSGEIKRKRRVSKNITIEDVTRANNVAGEPLKADVLSVVTGTLEKHNAAYLFDTVSIGNTKDGAPFTTVIEQYGTWSKCELQISTKYLGGRSLSEADAVFSSSGKTICNSLEDGLLHEIYHGRMAERAQYAVLERLGSTKGIDGISYNASLDQLETISEVGVLLEAGRDDKIPEEALKLFRMYFTEK